MPSSPGWGLIFPLARPFFSLLDGSTLPGGAGLYGSIGPTRSGPEARGPDALGTSTGLQGNDRDGRGVSTPAATAAPSVRPFGSPLLFAVPGDVSLPDAMKDIIIVDDHPLMRKGLALSLDAEADLNVAAQYSSAEDALEDIDRVDPLLAIVDVSLPGMSGMELIKHLQARKPDIAILVVSRHDEKLYAERSIRAGAKGYIMKLEAGDVIVKAVRQVLNGGIYVSDEINERLLMSMASGGRERISQSPLEVLSDRELEVFELTGRGSSTRDIAERLHLSVKTVESYRARIKKKLNLDSATELMKHAVQWVESEGAT